MAAWKPQSVRAIFAGLVPEEIAAAYEKLLDADGVLEEEASVFLGGADVLAELVRLGMATVYPTTPASPPVVDPADPELALQGVLNHMQARAADLQRHLTEGTRRTRAVHGMRRSYGSDGSGLAEVLTDRKEIQRMSSTAVNDAHQDFMELQNVHRDTPVSAAMITQVPEALRSRVNHRVIHDQAFVQDPASRQVLRARTAAGQQVRWRPTVHVKMQVADTSTALIALTRTGMSGALVIRSEPAIIALREYFELLWETSVPLNRPAPAAGASPLSPDQREILELLDTGLSHERIADRLSTSPKSLQRQIKTLYQMMGVTTLYQAGAAAVRRGWIN